MFGRSAFAALLARVGVHRQVPVAHGLIHQGRAETKKPAPTRTGRGAACGTPCAGRSHSSDISSAGVFGHPALGARQAVEADDQSLLPRPRRRCAINSVRASVSSQMRVFTSSSRSAIEIVGDAEAAMASPFDETLRRQAVQRLADRDGADAVALRHRLDLKLLVREEVALQDVPANLIVGLLRQVPAVRDPFAATDMSADPSRPARTCSRTRTGAASRPP